VRAWNLVRAGIAMRAGATRGNPRPWNWQFVVASSGLNPNGAPNMNRVLATCVIVSLSSCPSFAASPKIDGAIKTFKSVAADAGKLKVYCEMKKTMDAAGDKADAAADEKVDGYMKELGPDFQAAWNTGDDLDENSADAKALYAALDELSGKCK
jgi:hypothetical protein